jgi:hypothetical protein
MSLIRNFRGWLLLGCIGVTGVGGCQLQKTVPGPEPLSTATISTDPAMEGRAWSQTPAYYANDAVVTTPNYMPLQSQAEPSNLNSIIEPALFVGNIFYLPVGVFIDVPWKQVPSKSLSTPPTYTAMPPLPPSHVATQ